MNMNDIATVVSTRPGHGHFNCAHFETDLQAVQHAYDQMMTRDDLPKTLVLDSAARPFAFDGPFMIWQSNCRITSSGGVTIVPAPGYKGVLIETERRDETVLGEDRLTADVSMDNLWIDGKNQAMGIKLKYLQLSTISKLHIRSTDGPALWLSDECIENLFSDLILSDNCGNAEYPALLIEPEGEVDESNITVNSTQFSGVMIHFPTNDAMRIGAGQAAISKSRRQRKIQFVGCYFHSHDRLTRPLVTLADAFELSFVGTQMLIWKDDGVILQVGTEDSRRPTGFVMISHCIFCAKPDADVTAIKMVNVESDGPCGTFFGNSFGTEDGRLGHAVDWGPQDGKSASWAGNMVRTKLDPHIGSLPSDADISPLQKGTK